MDKEHTPIGDEGVALFLALRAQACPIFPVNNPGSGVTHLEAAVVNFGQSRGVPPD